MTQETFTHDSLEAFESIEEGQRWFEEHQSQITDLQSILKHVSPDGETITAPNADHESLTTEDTETDDLTVNNEASFSGFSAEELLVRGADGLGVNLGWGGFSDLQNGLDFADNEGYSRCYIPNGTYGPEDINDGDTELRPYQNQRIIGETRHGVVLDGEDMDTRVIRPTAGNANVELKRMTVRNDETNTNTPVRVERGGERLSEITVDQTGATFGIRVEDSAGAIMRDCETVSTLRFVSVGGYVERVTADDMVVFAEDGGASKCVVEDGDLLTRTEGLTITGCTVSGDIILDDDDDGPRTVVGCICDEIIDQGIDWAGAGNYERTV